MRTSLDLKQRAGNQTLLAQSMTTYQDALILTTVLQTSDFKMPFVILSYHYCVSFLMSMKVNSNLEFTLPDKSKIDFPDKSKIDFPDKSKIDFIPIGIKSITFLSCFNWL